MQHHALDGALHLGRIAKQHVHRHVDDTPIELTIVDHQVAIVRQCADHRNRATLTFAHRLEGIDAVFAHDENVTLLRFVAPDAHRRHARFSIVHLAQLDLGAVLAVIDSLGHRVRQSPGTDIVNQQYRVVGPHFPATVDNLLRAPLHLGIATLHRGKIQVFARCAACK